MVLITALMFFFALFVLVTTRMEKLFRFIQLLRHRLLNLKSLFILGNSSSSIRFPSIGSIQHSTGMPDWRISRTHVARPWSMSGYFPVLFSISTFLILVLVPGAVLMSSSLSIIYCNVLLAKLGLLNRVVTHFTVAF